MVPASICRREIRSTWYADFLERIIVDAQGLGSPYRLRGAPISSTLRVAVMDRFGKLRLLKRSPVSGFDFNAATNTIARSSRRATPDLANQVTSSKDAVVYVSYRVWKRPCPDDCAIGDSCADLHVLAGAPRVCCTISPTFECQPPQCPTCGPCETCDPGEEHLPRGERLRSGALCVKPQTARSATRRAQRRVCR